MRYGRRIRGTLMLIVGSVALFGLGVANVEAQETGSISGLISDSSGGAIPAVDLTLVESNTGQTRTSATNASGAYTFPLVVPGDYTLTAKKTGFTTRVVEDIPLRVNDTLRYDLTLEVGAVATEVTVEASPVAVNVETATIGEVIGSRQMVAFPLNGRSFIQLATLSAGVTPPDVSNERTESTTQGAGAGRAMSTVSISGVREVSPEFLVDGILTRHAGYGAVGAQPPVDSIAEFNVQRGYFAPKFGLPAVVNVAFKSGTNSFHGAIWEFVRNDKLDARSFFDRNKTDPFTLEQIPGSARPPLRQNQFGGNAGGPIVKDKLFFFGDVEWFKSRVSSTAFHTVPTPAMLQGDFSGLPTIFDPDTFDPVTGTKQPFLNNQIPPDRIGAFASTFNQFIPAPNSEPIASLGGANLVGTPQKKLDDVRFDFKIDYNHSIRDRFFVSFNFLDSDQQTTSLLPENNSNSPFRSRHPVASWTHTFGPTVVNDFRFGIDYAYLNSLGPVVESGAPNWPSELGLTNLNELPECNGPPAVFITDYDRFGFVFSNCIIYKNVNLHFMDNLAIVRGKHTLTMGGQLTRIKLPEIASFTQNGRLQYSGQFTGNAAADYLLDAPFTVAGSNTGGETVYLGWNPSLYINDDWKVTRKLTLNLGLRWQFTQPVVEENDNQYALDFATGEVTQAGTGGVPRGIHPSHYTDFAPRVGIAYALGENTALRTSYGIFWDRVPGDEVNFNSLSFPFTISSSFTSDLNVPTIDFSTLFPGPQGNEPPVGSGFFGITSSHNPYLQQWTFSLQQTLPWRVFTEIAYIGSKGTHLSKRVDANLARLLTPEEQLLPPDQQPTVAERRPLPNFSYILSDQSRASSWYHGLQFTVRKELSQGLTFLSGYTWSKSLDHDSYDGKGSRNYRPDDMDKGRSIFDMRHRWTGSFVYELPFGQTATGAAKQLIGGWEVSGIFTLSTGLPFSVRTAADYSNTGSFWNPRPNRLCNGNLPGSQQTPERWFDTSCFVTPPAHTYGDAGAQIMDTDGTTNTDLVLTKNFSFSETGRVQFRTEFFNAFNNVTFGRPGTRVEQSTFGVVSSALPGRIIQFGLKLMW